MPICPKCHKKIDCLREVRSGVEKGEMFFDEEGGYIYWRNEEFESDGDVLEYYCPECDKELDFDEQEAEEFLKRKDELQEIVAEKLNKIKKNDKKIPY